MDVTWTSRELKSSTLLVAIYFRPSLGKDTHSCIPEPQLGKNWRAKKANFLVGCRSGFKLTTRVEMIQFGSLRDFLPIFDFGTSISVTRFETGLHVLFHQGFEFHTVDVWKPSHFADCLDPLIWPTCQTTSCGGHLKHVLQHRHQRLHAKKNLPCVFNHKNPSWKIWYCMTI